MKKLIRDFFFYDAETFTWSQFMLDACLAFSMLVAFVASIWIAYAFFR
jgi:hypothetical protein